MNYGLIGLAVLIVGLVVIEQLAKDRDRWQHAALAEGQAHNQTKSVLAETRQQLQAKDKEINVLKTRLRPDHPAA